MVPPAPGVRFSPSVIGKHEVLLDVDEKAGEFPQYHRMPPSLPFHFRLDVSALKFSANGLAKAKWLQKLREELEKNWRYSRKDQERKSCLDPGQGLKWPWVNTNGMILG